MPFAIKTYLLNCETLPDPLDPDRKCRRETPLFFKQRMEHIQKLKNVAARKLSFGAGLLLWYALADVCGLAAGRLADMEFSYYPYGKPYFKNGPVFNLSHSGTCALLSIASGGAPLDLPLGCDIEKISGRHDPMKTARRFFAGAEYEALCAIQDSGQRAEQFARYWTAKESVLKATGAGLALPMHFFDVTDPEQVCADRQALEAWRAGHAREVGLLRAADRLLEQPLYLKHYEAEGYAVCVCSGCRAFDGELRTLPVPAGGEPC